MAWSDESDEPNRWLELLKTDKYSDMTIICQGVEFKVHRAVVCPQSPMLDAAFGGQLEVVEDAILVDPLVANHHEQEAQTGRINFPEEIPSIMSRIIYYLYTKEFYELRVPEVFRPLCADPDELTVVESGNEIDTMDQDLPQNISLICAKVAAMVYKSADMLMIDDLKSDAAMSFLSYARGSSHHHDFHDALQSMFKNTSD
jgi:hypothetical protein